MDDSISTKKHRQPALIAAALGLALALTAGTLATGSANAALDDGGFCIVASSDEGKFTGKRGPAGCSEATPVIENWPVLIDSRRTIAGSEGYVFPDPGLPYATTSINFDMIPEGFSLRGYKDGALDYTAELVRDPDSSGGKFMTTNPWFITYPDTSPWNDPTEYKLCLTNESGSTQYACALLKDDGYPVLETLI